jgi:hypothetical protein
MSQSPYTYTCPCGITYTVPVQETGMRRIWGTTRYAPRFQHTCSTCDRTNFVHDGIIEMTLQGGKRHAQR